MQRTYVARFGKFRFVDYTLNGLMAKITSWDLDSLQVFAVVL